MKFYRGPKIPAAASVYVEVCVFVKSGRRSTRCLKGEGGRTCAIPVGEDVVT